MNFLKKYMINTVLIIITNMALFDFPLDLILLIAMASKPCDASNLFLIYGWSKKDVIQELKKHKDVFLYDGKKDVPKDVPKDVTNVIIEEGVMTIEDGTFRDCTSLTSVVIPDSVTTIGGYAFGGCTSLTSVVIPDSVTTIGNCAFQGCTSLTSVNIPDSVTTIGKYAFP